MNKAFERSLIVAIGLIALVMAAGYAVVSAQGPAPATPPAPYSNPWGYGGGPGGMRGGMMGGWGGYGFNPTQGYTSTVPYGYRGWGPGGMMGGMMGGWGSSGYAPNATPLSLDQAATLAQQYVASFNNADLALVEVMEFSNNFYGEVEEKSTGVHAFEFLLDKSTGAVHPEPGPNMMWNSKYSPMAWMMGGFWFGTPTAQNSVMPTQAKQYAQQFLDSYLPGTTVADEVDAFYGYYTVHTLRDRKIVGMLSVNGSTGAVWYHTWHGDFVDMQEFD